MNQQTCECLNPGYGHTHDCPDLLHLIYEYCQACGINYRHHNPGCDDCVCPNPRFRHLPGCHILELSDGYCRECGYRSSHTRGCSQFVIYINSLLDIENSPPDQ